MSRARRPNTDATEDSGATITQLAALAGVSVATVSKVVNGHPDVAAETRASVEGVIREHGYRRRRRATRANLVEVVLHAIEGDYATEMLNGAARVAAAHGLAVAVSELHGAHTPDRDWIEGVLARRPAGVVAVFSGPTPAQRERLRSRGIPIVLVDPTDEPGPQVWSVGASNWSGGMSATRHLLDLGHRRIATITGPSRTLSGRARLDGYRAALDTAGVPVDPALIREGDFQIADGRVHGRDLLRLPHRPTAIVACNDGTALGVYQAAHEAGLRIPEDLSVVGFDDIPSSREMIPPLTTVRQPLREMAAAATEVVVALSRDEPPKQSRLVLATDLITRSSTAPPAH
ncbi:LacI family DNA-binding transcriptional regulator [Saccharothrix variisporea]|uniref:LacI family transcriptional regulator n=1 Tax=Saccharothrix variisporea TaxID=543527 RepID=A0A495X5J9_9PSEU|nr:LacI family DNA-binding transcriptional regulator [Saccharothrix variisporea]RKT67903.1 LacI family transcriptional regulator [Saccharothrix variisporea]